MEKQKIFIPHRIESEKDLPDKEDWYFVEWSKDYEKTLAGRTLKDKFYYVKDPVYKESWVKWFSYWLEEKETPTDTERKVEQSEYLTDKEERAFVSGWKAFKSKLGIK